VSRNHNRLCNAVVHRAAVGVNEILQESKPQFQDGRTISKRPFDRVPKGHTPMHERDNPYAEESLPRVFRLPI